MNRFFRVSINQILYFILIFGVIFVDCPTGIRFGVFGRCWLGIAVPFFFVLMITCNKVIRINVYINKMVSLILWLIIISLIGNLRHMIHYGSIQYLGENIYFKMCKTLLYWIVIMMYMVLILGCTVNMTKKKIFFPFLIAFFFLFVILLIELTQIPHAFENFHYNAYLGAYKRVRLTTTESSTTVSLIICYGFISIYYAFYLSKSRFLRILVPIMMVVFIATSGSKTLLLMCIVTIIGILWINRNRILQTYAPFVIGVGLIGVLVTFLLLGQLWGRMLEAAGSTATRSIQLIAAIAHSLKFPLGNGGAAYMLTYKEMLIWASEIVRNSFVGGKLNYWEISNQITAADDRTLGVIAGIWQMSLHIGICGMIYYISFTWKYLKNIFKSKARGSWILKVLLIDTVIMWLFTTTMYNVYYMWAVILICGLNIFGEEELS